MTSIKTTNKYHRKQYRNVVSLWKLVKSPVEFDVIMDHWKFIPGDIFCTDPYPPMKIIFNNYRRIRYRRTICCRNVLFVWKRCPQVICEWCYRASTVSILIVVRRGYESTDHVQFVRKELRITFKNHLYLKLLIIANKFMEIEKVHRCKHIIMWFVLLSFRSQPKNNQTILQLNFYLLLVYCA